MNEQQYEATNRNFDRMLAERNAYADERLAESKDYSDRKLAENKADRRRIFRYEVAILLIGTAANVALWVNVI